MQQLTKLLFLFTLLLGFEITAQTVDNLPIKFVQLTDLHVTKGNENDQLLRDIVAEINHSDNEFVVVTGDLSNRGSDEELQYVYDILQQLKKPYYIISGNHETNWSESAGLTFKKLWGADRFAFTHGDYLFTGFPCGPYMKMGDGFVKQEDLVWLDQTIKDTLGKKQRKVINFAHYPLDKNVSNYQEVLGVLAKYPTVVSFCGHGHTLKKFNFSGLSGIMGTALTTRDGKTQSYNTITISNDSIRMYRKLLGKPQHFEFAIANQVNPITLQKNSIVHKPLLQDVASVYSVPAFDGTSLFFCNSIGEVKSIDKVSAKVNWNVALGNSLYFTPQIVGKVIIVGTIEGELIGLNKKNGKLLWKTQLGSVLVGSSYIEGNKLYTSTASEFVCVNAINGKISWKNALPKTYSQGVPLVQDNAILYGVWDTYLYSLNKKSGGLNWKWNNGKDTQLLYSPGNVNMVATKNRVYVVSPERYLTIVDLHTGKTLYRTNKWRVRESMGKSADGKYFYAKTMDGELLRLPLSDELILNDESITQNSVLIDLKLGYDHNPAAILEHNNKIYIGSRKGEIVIVDATTLEILETLTLGTSSVNGFVRDNSNSVWTTLIEGSIFKLP